MRQPVPHRDTGLTLIELVVAMSVFALVAVMGVQSLTGTLRINDRLVEIDTRTAALAQGLALLRNDMSAAVPMLFYPPGQPPGSALDQVEGGLDMSLAGQPLAEDAHTDRHRVEWRVDPVEGVLTRRHWPTLIPQDSGQRSGETVVMRGVSELRLRTLWDGVGWVDGPAPPLGTVALTAEVSGDEDNTGAPPAAYFSTLPLAIEVTVVGPDWGSLRLLESLR
ncbi:type II secretion system protein GspJ [uncultured Tateyamaria sp.]|uniref:PulJ/GspJ family protein n=1 Tax=uncultured Tateyamaria sp. TaxID=455651 RepID=UPI0026016126|nr:type II secretion system protein GspJ [uncultured Tateyamaria sp.]